MAAAAATDETRYRTWVLRLGMPARVAIPPEVLAQLWLDNQLRNTLVELAQARQAALLALWSSHPEVADLEDAEADVSKRIAELSEQRRLHRMLAHSTISPYDEELKELRKQHRELRTQRRAAISAVHKQVGDELAEIEQTYYSGIKATYATYVQQGIEIVVGTQRGVHSLYWATYNDRVRHHKTAMAGVRTTRASGGHASLRFRAYNAAGGIAVQIQRHDSIARSPAAIADENSPWRNVLCLRPWLDPAEFAALPRSQRRSVGRGTVRMRVGGKQAAEIVELPVQVHRMLSADAEIVEARLIVEQLLPAHQSCQDRDPETGLPRLLVEEFSEHRMFLSLVVREQATEPVFDPSLPTVAVHCGWRKEDDGAIRVATWAATAPIEVPAAYREFIRTTDGQTGTVVLPVAWRAKLDRAARLQSRRDSAHNDAREQFAAWSETNLDAEEHPDFAPATIRAWRSVRRLLSVARAWRVTPPPTGRKLAFVLDSWRRSEITLARTQVHGRRKDIARRDNAWHCAAKLFVGAGNVLIDDISLTTLSQLRTDGADLPEPARQHAANQRVDAAPANLRTYLRQAGDRDGRPVTVIELAYLGSTHAACGHRQDSRQDGHQWSCGGCGAIYDVDTSTTSLMLQRGAERLEEAR